MNISGIVAEFDPFHSGHAHLVNSIKNAGADAVIAAMSGCFVQRAAPAIMSPAARARAAVKNGVDIVFQLPVTRSLAPAESFAYGGCSLLQKTGVVDTLVFGSESADMEAVESCAEVSTGEQFKAALSAELAKGVSFAAARQEALKICGALRPEILSGANDTLGVEYVKALKKLGGSINPVCIKRLGAGHGEAPDGGFASASYLRELLLDGELEKCREFMPQSAFEVLKAELESKKSFVNINKLENAVLYKMRTSCASEIALAPDVSEGLENRLEQASRQACSLEELFSLTKTKRYSHARIRRIVMSTFLGITAEDAACDIPYLKVLAFSAAGKEILREIACKSPVPLIMRHSDSQVLDARAKRIYELDCKAADVFSLGYDEPLQCGSFQRSSAVLVR